MSDDLIGYERLVRDALRGVARAALTRAVGSAGGLPGRHHFYITFRTAAPGVVLPPHLRARYPGEMTIVLEHQYWDLEVHPDRFSVILRFAGRPETLVIPFAALTRFQDPAVHFALAFEAPGTEDIVASEPPEAQSDEAPRQERAETADAPAVVSLDAFRKKST